MNLKLFKKVYAEFIKVNNSDDIEEFINYLKDYK
jgi:hypothetical protein